MTYKYRLEMQVPGYHLTPMRWLVRASGQFPGYGKPTNENLEKHVRAFEASTQEGGPNAHLGPTRVSKAKIIHQETGVVVAAYAG